LSYDLIEKMARALEKSLAFDVDSDALASELTREEHRLLATAALAVALEEIGEECAQVAECAFDDRPNSRSGHHSEMDWTDGYRDGAKDAAAKVRTRIAEMRDTLTPPQPA